MSHCLLLNASFEPLRALPLRRALRLVMDGKAEILESDGQVGGTSGPVVRPVVIRLKKFIHVPRRFRKQVNNTFLFARDGYRCQYCGRHQRELSHREGLNRDHVIPKCQGGENTWENCVTSCSSCNSRKDNRTPAQAGMKLLSVPTEPMLVHLQWAVRKLTPMQQKWVTYFYGESVGKTLAG